MEDDSMATKPKGEATVKTKDGYVQLAEKMEQVRNQVAKMERKYEELYQTVKEKEHSRNPSLSSDQESPEETKSQSETVVVEDKPPVKETQNLISENKAPSIPAETKEEPPSPPKPSSDMDIEKMEDNPFL